MPSVAGTTLAAGYGVGTTPQNHYLVCGIFATGILAAGLFAVALIAARNFHRMEFSPRGIFAAGNFRCMDFFLEVCMLGNCLAGLACKETTPQG